MKQIWSQFNIFLKISVIIGSYLFLSMVYGVGSDIMKSVISPAKADDITDTTVKYIVIHHTGITNPVQLEMVNSGHKRRGYDASAIIDPTTKEGYHVCYNIFIGTTGNVIQTRPLTDREFCTRNQYINQHAIQIVMAGDFNAQQPSPEQIHSLFATVAQLKWAFPDAKVIPHSSASPDACPGKNMQPFVAKLGYVGEQNFEKFNISRYYSPEENQAYYYRSGTGAYIADVKVNCGLNSDGSPSDCAHTADGFDLRGAEPSSVAACPPSMPFGTKLWVQGYGIVTCHDHGSAIKGNRLDIWSGFGTAGVDRIHDTDYPSGELLVMRLP